MRDGSEEECEESCSRNLVDTSFTYAQYSVCPQSSSLSIDHMRKHEDSIYASAWLKVTLKKGHLLYTCAFDIMKCMSW